MNKKKKEGNKIDKNDTDPSLNADTIGSEPLGSVDDDQTELLSENIQPQNKRKKRFIIIGVVAGICILTAFTSFVLSQEKTSVISKALNLGEKYLEEGKYEGFKKNLTISNTESNLRNNGYAAYYDGTTYYSVDNCIYKKKDNETSLVFKDTIESCPSYINVVDDWIYYYRSPSKGPDEQSGYYKIKIDGTNNTKIVTGFNNYNFFILNNRIYYTALHIGTGTFDTIRSTNLDGLDPKILIENCNVFTIDNGWIYYRPCEKTEYDHGEYRLSISLYRMKMDGSQQECLFEDLDTYGGIWVKGDSIYMLKSNMLYKASLVDENFKLLSNDKIDNININNGWIYYTSAESLTIKKMKTDGSEVSTLIAQTDEEIAADYGPLIGSKLSESDRYSAYTLINISGDNLYYLGCGFKDGAICFIANLDGSNITKLGYR